MFEIHISDALEDYSLFEQFSIVASLRRCHETEINRLIFALGMPVVLIFLFGYAVSFDIERVPLVVVDHQGKNGLDATAYFMGHGLQNVRCLRGGIDAWSQEVDPKVRRYKLG